jgi:phosphatidylserine/phosphatidylglycerophosphate/cardiolipin synthase-like enzyme
LTNPTRLEKRVLIGLLATLLLALPTLGRAGTMSQVEERGAAVGAEVIFNAPDDAGHPSLAIENRLIELIDQAPAGSTITFSLYTWTRIPVAQALKRAQDRGVSVHLVLDGGIDDDAANPAMEIVKSAGFSSLVFCEGESGSSNTACIADRGEPHSINHNKLFMFSETGGMSDVVVVSSFNLTNTQTTLFNNAVLIHDDPALYAFYERHVDNMLQQRKNNDYFNTDDGYFRSDQSRTTTYMSPRADSNGGTGEQSSTDTYARILSYITEAEDGCELSLVQLNISDARTPVANEIARVARLGCRVRIVYDSMGDDNLALLEATNNVELERYIDREDSNVGGRDTKVGVHSKYMIFSGNYNGIGGRTIVFTGSHNISGPALRTNDEILVKVERPEVSNAFETNFDTIWERAECVNPTPDEGPCP